MVARSTIVKSAGWLVPGIAGLCLVGLMIAWSGVYNIAASRGHWAIVEWFLAFGMRNSVATHSIGIAVPALDDPDLARLGAGHFHGGCASCHGAPGIPTNPIVDQMLPPPPGLSTAARDWQARELFWIVKHGIKYTGMPGWVALERDDEVWAVVAFLQKLPSLDAASYRSLAVGSARVPVQSGPIAGAPSVHTVIAECARCHGADDEAPKSSRVPVLHGQPVEYLAAQLEAYAAGRRRSGIMQPVASYLAPEELGRIAAYYSSLRVPHRPRRTLADEATIEVGRSLAVDGLPATGLPPCLACHGAQALAAYPRLPGQHADYMAGQLRLWKRGLRSESANAMIMAPIAQRLSDSQIEAVSMYFSTADPSAIGAQRQ